MRREEWEQETQRIRRQIEMRQMEYAAIWGFGAAIIVGILLLLALGKEALCGALCLGALVGAVVYAAFYKGANLYEILLAGVIGAVIGWGIGYNGDDVIAGSIICMIIYIVARAFEKKNISTQIQAFI
jgi:heme O synthase-like polyprenyltransferase